MSRVKITDDTKKFIKAHESVFDEAVETMAKDMLRLSKQRVPRKDNDLTRSGQVEKGKNPMEWYVSYGNDGSNASDYAAVQERGYRSGARAFSKYTSPGTGKNYLKGAGERISQQTLNYLRQATQKIRGF
jgi:hypothetical protein